MFGWTDPFGTMFESVMEKTHQGIEFNDPAERERFAQEFAGGNWLSRTLGTPMQTGTFDVQLYPFVDLVWETLIEQEIITNAHRAAVCGRLDRLHEVVKPEHQRLDADEINEATRAMYATPPAFAPLYKTFINDVIVTTILGEACLYQSTPTIRIHFPRQQGFDWQPRFHSDIMLGHPPQEVNIWVPFTRTFSTNSMYLCDLVPSISILQRYDFSFDDLAQEMQTNAQLQAECRSAGKALDLAFGQFVLFDSRCLHATQFNTTESTRVSMDVRVIPVADYEAIQVEYRGTGRRRMRFTRSEFYADEILGKTFRGVA